MPKWNARTKGVQDFTTDQALIIIAAIEDYVEICPKDEVEDVFAIHKQFKLLVQRLLKIENEAKSL